jgi:predicted nucleic acid-binding protein
MSSIRTERIALDTNIYIHAVRRTPGKAACSRIVGEFMGQLHVFIPSEVVRETHRNLDTEEQHEVYRSLNNALEVSEEYGSPPEPVVAHYQSLGAKKGDAVIAASLDAAGVRWLISENRHFLAEIPHLPFQVLTAEQAIALLD